MLRCVFLATLLAGMAAAQPLPTAFGVSTYAGDAALGDGGPATQAILDAPWGLVVDAKGELYICDWYHERIRKVDASGNMQWVAGAPSMRTAPYNLSEGDASRVFINYPQFITLAPDGTIYFTNSYRICRLNLDGTLTWIAGSNSSSSSSADGTSARSALFANVRGLAVDKAGQVFFFELDKKTVRKVNLDGKVETVAGASSRGYGGDGGPAVQAGFSYIYDIAFDAEGNLYVADSGCIRKIDAKGTITRFAGDPNSSSDTGVLLTTQLRPRKMTFDAAGNLYLHDGTRIKKIDKSGKLTVIAGSGKYNDPYIGDNALAVGMTSVDGLAADAQGNVYYSGSFNRILKITPQGKQVVFAGTGQYKGDGAAALNAWLHGPELISMDGGGGFAFRDSFNNCYRHVDAQGTIKTLAGKCNVETLSPKPAFDAKTQPATSIYMDVTGPIAAKGDGTFAIYTNNLMLRITATGTQETLAGQAGASSTAPKDGETAAQQPLLPVNSMTYDTAGRLCFSDRGDIWRIETNGKLYRMAGTGTPGLSSEKGVARSLPVSNPTGLTFDGDTLYYFDAGYIRKLTPDGQVQTVAGGGTNTRWISAGEVVPALSANLSGTNALAVAPGGAIYGTHSNDLVYRLRPDGQIERVAGDTNTRYGGDGGAALAASFKGPTGIGADKQGNLYVADRNNNVIRKLTPLTPASIVKVGGDEQTAVAGKPFELPLEVDVLSDGGIPVSMVPLEVRVLEGSATLVMGTSATGAAGRYSTKVTGDAAGALVIQIGVSGLAAVEFHLNVQPDVPPAPETPVLTAMAGPVAPGKIVVLRGEKFAFKTAAATPADVVDGKLPQVFQGLCVEFSGLKAAILAVAPKAVAVQVPPQFSVGTATVRATNQCGTEAPLPGETVEVSVAETAPAFYFSSTGEQNIVWAQSSGENRLRLFLTGNGAPAPAPEAGALPVEALPVAPSVTVWFAGKELAPDQILLNAWAPRAEGWPLLRLPEFFGTLELLAPGLGVVELAIPADAGDDPWPVTLKAGEAFSQENAWVKRPIG